MGVLERYYAMSRAVGLAINIQKDGTALIEGCQVSVSKRQLSFDKKAMDFGIDEISKKFDSGLPAAINLRGRGVLHKKIDKVGEINQANFSLVLPNAEIDDFYVQHFISGEFSFVTVVRKAEADKWIKEVSEAGLVPLMLSLGPYPAEHIFPQLNVYDKEIRFDGHIISRDEDKNWIAYRFEEGAETPFVLKVENEQVDQRLVIPYAAVFQLILADKLDPVQAITGGLESAFIKAREDRQMKTYGFLILILFFVLLLVNFIVLSALNSSNNQLTSAVSRTARNTVDLQGMTDVVHRKEALLHDLGWDAGVRKSIMADRVAALMPRELSLKYLSFSSPEASGVRGANTLHFADGQIRIRGVSQQIIPVNEWVARLKTYKWVKNVRMDSYSYNNELEAGVFTITINY